jgi:hypothetical protein
MSELQATESSRRGRFEIFKQTGRIAHFASVAVEVTPASESSIAIDPIGIGLWVDALNSGVSEGLAALETRGVKSPLRVQVTELMTTAIDSCVEDVRAAALLATLSAFLDPSMLPAIRLSEDQRRWLLDWPDY